MLVNVLRPLAILFLAAFAATPAAAQTTIALGVPEIEVTDTSIRGGSYGNTNLDGLTLATQASSDTGSVKRALLKFDTETRVPKGAAIQSAVLTLTLKGGGPQARTLSVYRVAESFNEREATWNQRKAGMSWLTAGGALGRKYADVSAGTTAGTKVVVDLKSLVQEVVNGTYGSRYTRVALLDAGASSIDSLKEFHSSEAADASVRPRLTVVYGSATTSTPPSTSTSTATNRLRVLHWNIHHGVGTDGVYDINRLATWIAKFTPDVVSLNEVEKFTSWGNEDQPARFAALLQQKTGKTWYYSFAQRYGNGAANGQGNLVLSRFPLATKAYRGLDCNRSAALATFVVNGRNITVASTHLDEASSSCRTAEVNELKSWVTANPEQRIVAGDWNAQYTSSHVTTMTSSAYYDAWAKAKADGTAKTYPDNPSGATRNSRIDYIFQSRSATYLRLLSAEVFDTRNSAGKMPSDHKPLLAVFEVR